MTREERLQAERERRRRLRRKKGIMSVEEWRATAAIQIKPWLKLGIGRPNGIGEAITTSTENSAGGSLILHHQAGTADAPLHSVLTGLITDERAHHPANMASSKISEWMVAWNERRQLRRQPQHRGEALTCYIPYPPSANGMLGASMSQRIAIRQ
jgi:hypothetical protein